jgi:hypothetical protein
MLYATGKKRENRQGPHVQRLLEVTALGTCKWRMIMTDTNTTNELVLNDKQLNMVVELESKRDSLMTAGNAGKLAEILSDDRRR